MSPSSLRNIIPGNRVIASWSLELGRVIKEGLINELLYKSINNIDQRSIIDNQQVNSIYQTNYK